MTLLCVSCNFSSRSHARCVQRQVPWLRSAVAAHQQGRRHPCRGGEFDPHGFSGQQTIKIPMLRYTWWSILLRFRASSSGAVVEETVALPQLQLVKNLAGCRQHPGRGAETVSHGLADQRNSPVSLRQGDRRPCCAGGASTPGASWRRQSCSHGCTCWETRCGQLIDFVMS